MPFDGTHIEPRFARFFSVDSAKAAKATEYGYLNGINYMAPAATGGRGNLCAHASAGCIALCLGWFSGQAGMVAGNAAEGMNSVRASRIAKVEAFMSNRPGFMREMMRAAARLIRDAKRNGLQPCARPNGSTDIAFEAVRCVVDAALAAELSRIAGENIRPGIYACIMDVFPMMQWVDYTKNPARMRRNTRQNYHLTFSRSETNEAECIALLSEGHNVAVVFRSALPAMWNGFQVIDGDKHDLRHLDPRGGFVVGLLPKGAKARRDASGFVVD